MRTFRLVAPFAVAAALTLSCGEPSVPASVEVIAVHREALPSDPGDAGWAGA